MERKDVVEAIWTRWVPSALADGTLKPKPDPVIIGKGLACIQEGLDQLRKGVSGKKLVLDLC